ncbi:hypothetical protein V2J09_008450 [Rumex salicifolius]
MIPISHRHRGGAAEPDSPPIPGVVLKKGPWSAAEDKILIEYVREHGEGNWNAVQRNTALQRCGKSCRLRWANHLRPNLKKGAFSSEEERLIIDLHSKLGNKWARISAQLPGRTDNEVKNYWNTRVKRRLRQGLPLYPHNRQSPQSLSSLPPPPPQQQPSSPPPAPPLPVSLSHLKTPFLDPTSLPFPAPFFSFNNPSFLSNPPPEFLIQPCFSNLGFSSQHPIQTHVELQHPNPLELGFDYKLELPSNQFCPNLAGDDDDDVDDCEAGDGTKFYPNVSERSNYNNNSGLLDALLEEAQSRAATARNLKKDCLDGDQWDSIYGNSSSGEGEDKGDAKIEEQDEHSYYTNDDLSSILNLIPSLVTAPKYNEGHQESSNGQSSNVSDENARHISSNTEWFSTSTSYTSWNNLPRIC